LKCCVDGNHNHTCWTCGRRSDIVGMGGTCTSTVCKSRILVEGLSPFHSYGCNRCVRCCEYHALSYVIGNMRTMSNFRSQVELQMAVLGYVYWML
jgi:hypothetical protein